MSQALKCDGCGVLTAGVAVARCEIITRIDGVRVSSCFEYCGTCAARIGDVSEAARRVVFAAPQRLA